MKPIIMYPLINNNLSKANPKRDHGPPQREHICEVSMWRAPIAWNQT